MIDFTTQLAARWVDAEKAATELRSRYEREVGMLCDQRDEAGKALEMSRGEIDKLRATVAELTDKLERAEMAAEIMSDDLNQRADNDEQGAAELAQCREALADGTRRNATQVQTIIEARRQRDEADQRANQLADKVDQLAAQLDDARHSAATWCASEPVPFRPDGSGLDAQTIAAGMAAQGREFRVVSPYLVGQWRVLRTYGSNDVELTPMFSPAREQWSLSAPLRWLQLDTAEF